MKIKYLKEFEDKNPIGKLLKIVLEMVFLIRAFGIWGETNFPSAGDSHALAGCITSLVLCHSGIPNHWTTNNSVS